MFAEALIKSVQDLKLKPGLTLPPGGESNPIHPGEIALRIGANVRNVIDSVTGSDWFGPNQPMVPVGPANLLPRVFDYPFGSNLYFQPRQEQSGPSFHQLRQLADNYDILRLVIETRKEQICKVPQSWKVDKNPNEKKRDYKLRNEADPRVKFLTQFFKRPDRENSFQSWLRIFLEEVFVTDALTIWPVHGKNGLPVALKIIDGATIKPLHDTQGWRPSPPDPAYQQIVKGMPALNLTSDQLLYSPRNPRVHKFYGYSPVEQIIMITNIAINRQISQLAAFTDGNMPEMIVGLPAAWSTAHIKEFQNWFDSMAGDLQMRRRVRFLPETKTIVQTKESMLKDEFDEWLARVVCYAFSVPPTPFVKQNNRATAQTANEAATQEGTTPLLSWISEQLTFLASKYMGLEGVTHSFDTEEDFDHNVQSEIEDRDIKNGSRSVDEVREDRGDEPIGMSNAIYTPNGPILIDQIVSGEWQMANPADMAQQPDDQQDPDKKDVQRLLAAGVIAKKKALRPLGY